MAASTGGVGENSMSSATCGPQGTHCPVTPTSQPGKGKNSARGTYHARRYLHREPQVLHSQPLRGGWRGRHSLEQSVQHQVLRQANNCCASASDKPLDDLGCTLSIACASSVLDTGQVKVLSGAPVNAGATTWASSGSRGAQEGLEGSFEWSLVRLQVEEQSPL